MKILQQVGRKKWVVHHNEKASRPVKFSEALSLWFRIDDLIIENQKVRKPHRWLLKDMTRHA